MSAQPPSNPPPPGGYGASGPRAGFGPAYPPAPPAGGGSRAVVIIAVVVSVVVFMVGTLAVLAIFGMRKYIGASKQAEVKNSLGQMAKDSVFAYERERLPPPNGPVSTDIPRRLCASASRPVPADPALISGKKYQSSAADWEIDKARDAGFACLRFEMTSPQYYQYRYEATASSFVAGGRGDLNGNGKFSDFTLRGEISDSRLRLSPSIEETDPDE